MPPAADPAAPVPHRHVDADLEVLVRRVLAQVAVVEPVAVDEPTAAKLIGVCGKTLAGLPAAEVGRARIGRRVVYELASLRAYIRKQVQNAN